MRATISAVIAALALIWVGTPPEGGIMIGLALGWLLAAALPDRDERVPQQSREEELSVHFYDG